MGDDLLSSIGVCVAAAAALALVGNRLRQPVILAYLLAGVLIGPIGLRLVNQRQAIQTVAEIGLILLLFIIGLEIDLKKLLGAGLPVALTGLLQVPLCIGLGLGFFALLKVHFGNGGWSLLYLAACMSMSSTMIVVKLLYDKFELDTLPGRITLGVLVFQDVWAVAMLAVQPNLGHPDLAPVIASVLKGALLVIWALAASRYLLPRIFRSVAKVPELVVISALAWCFFLAAAASVAGLSREMGALIAGVSLSTFPYNLDVIAKVTSIRDFFVTLFFVGLGMQIPIPGQYVLMVALAASIFLIASRVVIAPILYALRMGHRTSLIPAINLAQVSEFSIVIASLGLAKGHIPADVVTVVVLVFAITSVLSTYLIGNNHQVYDGISSLLRQIGLHDLDHEHSREPASGDGKPVLFLGFFRDASSVLHELARRDERRRHRFLDQLLVIDFNPHVIGELEKRGVACVYGDVAHVDTLRHAHVEQADLVISTITDEVLRGTTNLRLMRNVRAISPSAKVVLATDHIDQALKLYEAGADWVYVQRLHSAADLADAVDHGRRHGFGALRSAAVAELRQRDEVIA